MSPQKRILVAYYSHQGHTRQLAEALAARLGADCEEIIETRRIASPFLHAIAASWQVTIKRLPALQAATKNPAAYDLVLVGGPVYGGMLAPAARAFLTTHKQVRQLALFATSAGHDYEPALAATVHRHGLKAVAQFGAAGSDLAGAAHQERLAAFCKQLTR